jgi:hypothetical protein
LAGLRNAHHQVLRRVLDLLRLAELISRCCDRLVDAAIEVAQDQIADYQQAASPTH